MKKEIQLSVPNLNMEIVDNLKECIETGWVSTGGRFITEFERKIAKYVGTEDAVSAQSGTAGLHVSLRILGVEAGDEVIAPTLTFIAAVNPIFYMGAQPVFMDCDKWFTMDPVKLEAFLRNNCETCDGQTFNKKTGRRIAAIVVVHVFGNLANMEKIMSIAGEFNIKVLEDATEALGSYYTSGKFAGQFAGTVGDMGVYSFNANKIITTGGGGMIVSRNQEYLDAARYLTITAKNDSLYFVHDEAGYNYRMLNLQAALGVSQIDELEGFITTKKANFEAYKEGLADVAGITVMPFVSGARCNHWFYSLYIDQAVLGISRDDLMHALIDAGIQCRPVWRLNHMQRPYSEAETYEIERALDYVENVLNVPCSTNLTLEDVKYVCDMIKQIVGFEL